MKRSIDKRMIPMREMPPLSRNPDREDKAYSLAEDEVFCWLVENCPQIFSGYCSQLLRQAEKKGIVQFDRTTRLWKGNPEYEEEAHKNDSISQVNEAFAACEDRGVTPTVRGLAWIMKVSDEAAKKRLQRAGYGIGANGIVFKRQ